MADRAGPYAENTCPKCRCNISDYLAEQRKKALFEIQFGNVLKRSRALVKLSGGLIGMIFGASFCVFLLLESMDNPARLLKRIFSSEGRLFFSILLVALLFCFFSLIGFLVGTKMFKSQDEKKLWENFNADKSKGMTRGGCIDVL